jgi:hypothetical protein
MNASPVAAANVPSVAMSGEMPPRVVMSPLTRPHSRPDSTAAPSPARHVGSPSPPIASITLRLTTPENTSTEPTDRSMPAIVMTNVIPTAMSR